MSTLELQQIEQQLLTLSLKDLQEFISELMSKKLTGKKVKNQTILTPNLDKIPSRDATAEEARIIDEYLKNPQLLSAQETKSFLQSLKMKI